MKSQGEKNLTTSGLQSLVTLGRVQQTKYLREIARTRVEFLFLFRLLDKKTLSRIRRGRKYRKPFKPSETISLPFPEKGLPRQIGT